MLLDYAILFFGALSGAIIFGSTGFAFALVGSAIWLHILPPAQVVPLVVMCALILNIALTWRLWKDMRVSLLWPFLLGAIFGVPLGVIALHQVNAGLVRDGIGGILIVYSTFMLVRPRMLVLRFTRVVGRIMDGIVGMAGGVMGGATGLNGVLPTLWCGLRGWSKIEQRGVFQPYALVVHFITLLWLGGVGATSRETLLHLLVCLPGLALGGFIGLKLFHRVSEAGFRRMLLWLLLLSGLSLVLRFG